MDKIYVMSDTHFGHKNVIQYCRPNFKSVEEMDETLIKNWNDTVDNDDTVFFLGDFALGPSERLVELGKRLNGKKILIRGNHDRASDTKFREAGFQDIFKKPLLMHFDKFDITIEFSHAPNQEAVYPNVYGHLHEKGTNDKTHFCVCPEVNNYKPVLLDDIVKYFKEQK